LSVGDNKLACHDTNIMTELGKLSRPVMHTRAGFHTDNAWR